MTDPTQPPPSNPYLAVSTTEGDIYYVTFPRLAENSGASGGCVKGDGRVGFTPTGSTPEVGLCTTCKSRHFLAACPHCGIEFALAEDAMQRLEGNVALPCPNPGCDVHLVLFQMPRIAIVAKGASTPEPWSSDLREADYLARASAAIPASEALRFQVYHRTVGARIISADHHLKLLKNAQLNSFVIVTKPSAETEPGSLDTPSLPKDIQRDILFFNFVNGLRSSLDMLAQELAVFYASALLEDNVDVRSIRTLSASVPRPLISRVSRFLRSDTYKYLNDLRRTMQHRRVPLYKQQDSFDTSFVLSTEQPTVVTPERSLTYLPDNPLALPGSETYDKKHEVVVTFERLLREVRGLVFEVYALATR